MQLLVAVINHAELVDDVLAGFVELGITGATLLESKGMGRVLTQDLPIFAALESLNARSRTTNRTIFCVADEAKVDAANASVDTRMKALDGAELTIVGHTDTSGSAGYNQTLSAARARACRRGCRRTS